MGTTGALTILGVTIVGIVLLCVRYRVHAFLALMAACAFLGIASGMPLGAIGSSIEKGMGNTLGFLAPILALGAFMGKMLEVSGGAQRLAKSQSQAASCGGVCSRSALVTDGSLG